MTVSGLLVRQILLLRIVTTDNFNINPQLVCMGWAVLHSCFRAGQEGEPPGPAGDTRSYFPVANSGRPVG